MPRMAAVVVDGWYRFGRLVLCGTCRELRGPWRTVRDPQVYAQQCACEGAVQRAEHADDEDWEPERWPGFDYNQAAELCRCCGLEVLASGSRWSVWFCDHCQDWVCDLNERAGGCVIPIGRHSIMNGVVLPATRAKDADAIDEFVAAAGSLWRLQDWTEAWARQVVERNLVAVGLEPEMDVALADYLEQVELYLVSKAAAVRVMFAAAGA